MVRGLAQGYNLLYTRPHWMYSLAHGMTVYTDFGADRQADCAAPAAVLSG